MAWLTGWNYRKSITLSRASGAVTNYPMMVKVGESTGSSGADVVCNTPCLSNFNDIRFTTSGGTAALDYWIESISGAAGNQTAIIWIEFDSIGTGATTFYMYYGNGAAPAVTNGSNTFSFFDDFLGVALDTNKWYHWIQTGSSTVASSILTIRGGSSNYEAQGCKMQFDVNYAWRARVKCPTEVGTDVNIFGIDGRSATGSGTATQAGMRWASSRIWIIGNGGSDTRPERIAADVCTDYRVAEVKRNSTTSVIFSLDDSVKNTTTLIVPTGNMGFMFYQRDTSGYAYYDWALVRQWLVTEPAFGTWSAQDTILPNKELAKIKKMYVGSDTINKAYHGADVIWRGKHY